MILAIAIVGTGVTLAILASRGERPEVAEVEASPLVDAPQPIPSTPTSNSGIFAPQTSTLPAAASFAYDPESAAVSAPQSNDSVVGPQLPDSTNVSEIKTSLSSNGERVTDTLAPHRTGSTPTSLPVGLAEWHRKGTSLKGVRRVSGPEHIQLHFSWMCDLLPHLDHQKLYDQFDFSRSWTDPRNIELTSTVIPQFLNPADPRKTWEGYPFDGIALTHFVGVSGIEDSRNVVAAKLPRSDPRAGVFGYDSVAAPADITDGTSQTLLIVGSGEIAAPWVQAGGATIRGAREPYFDSLSGFGSRNQRKAGTMAVLADGSTRFISADVDPSVFRAMSTIHGGESVDIGRWAETADWIGSP